MVGIKYNQTFKDELVNLIPGGQLLEKDLLKDFVTYWWVRKSHPFLSAFEMDEVKKSLSSTWLTLIESNQKFRDKYGEEKAKTIVMIVEKALGKHK